jgi:hypothetical protein
MLPPNGEVSYSPNKILINLTNFFVIVSGASFRPFPNFAGGKKLKAEVELLIL